MFDELKNTCKYFNTNNLSYCILRTPIDHVDGSEFEFDILIKDTQLKIFHHILIEKGFVYSQDDIISHHHYRRGLLHLDITVSLCYGDKREYFVSLGHEVLDRAIFIDDMYFPDNMDEFTMLIFRCLFDKKSFKKYSDRIIKLINIIGETKCMERMSSIFNLN